jgi:hypothetical protein
MAALVSVSTATSFRIKDAKSPDKVIFCGGTEQSKT